ncbi:MAG: M48 family metalloprotease, partial [Alphaproteobacteria bacterium]
MGYGKTMQWVVLHILFIFWALPALAASMVLDTELNDWLGQLAAPLVKAGGLSPNTVGFHMLVDNEVNAFATPDNNIYMHTGLVLRAESPAEVQGVLAHELGHVLAKHGFQRYADIRNATIATIAGAVVGLGAAAAGGGTDAAMAGILGGQALGTGNFLRHSRTQEREADQHAMLLLNASQLSASGMVTFFNKLNNDQMLSIRTPPQHLLTHPLPAERMDSLRY